MAVVPISLGVDSRNVLVDTTGTALGTAGNPLVTAAGGGGSSVFPTAAAIADATSNPTVTEIETFPMCWNATNWNRVMGVTPFLAGLTPSSGGAGMLAAASVVYDATNDSLAIQRTLHSFGDGIAGGTTVGLGPFLYNGATWDKQRANVDLTVLASAARTTTQTVAVTTYNCAGIIVYVNVTNVGTGSITPSIQYVDPVSGQAFTILTGTAITTNTTQILRIYPGIAVTANVTASEHVSRVVNVVITANNANSATYSVGATLLV